MSELDRAFGPKRPATVAVKRTPTAWPDAPERLRGLLDKWEEIHHTPTHKSKRKSMINGAHRYYEEVSADVALMAQAYEHLRKIGYVRKNLGSLIVTAQDLRDNPQPGSKEYEEEFFDGWNFEE